MVYTDIAMISRSSTGIRNLLTFSIPFSTPRNTATDVSSRNNMKNTVGCVKWLIKLLKKGMLSPDAVIYSAVEAFSPPPVMNTDIYFSTQPPITQ